MLAGIRGAKRHHAAIGIWQISLNNIYPTFSRYSFQSLKSHLEFKAACYFIESDLIFAPKFKK